MTNKQVDEIIKALESLVKNLKKIIK